MQAEAQASLVEFINTSFLATFPSQSIVFDNNPFDWNNPPPIFAEVEIEFHDGRQANIAQSPATRLYGFVYISIHAREGTGSKTSLGMLDTLASALKYQHIDTVNLGEPKPNGSSTPKGWHIRHLKVEFYTDPA